MAWWKVNVEDDNGDEASRGFTNPEKALDFAFLADGYGHDVKMFERDNREDDTSEREVDWWNNGAGWDSGSKGGGKSSDRFESF